MTSVRTEKYYYTEKLLELFGGPVSHTQSFALAHVNILYITLASSGDAGPTGQHRASGKHCDVHASSESS